MIKFDRKLIALTLFTTIRLGSDPHLMFPYEAFQDQLRKFGVYSVFVGTLLLLINNIDSYEIPNLDEFNACGKQKELVKRKTFQLSEDAKRDFNQIVVDLFYDLARLDYI